MQKRKVDKLFFFFAKSTLATHLQIVHLFSLNKTFPHGIILKIGTTFRKYNVLQNIYLFFLKEKKNYDS